MMQRRFKWVSHNKFLVGSGDGGNKKPHARNPNFDSEETKLLIQLWGDPQVQRTLITIHKKHPVIAKIAERMRSHGYNRSTEEINTRIKNLKCLYNRIKKDLESGLLNEPSWKHYGAMDEILSRPVFGNSNKVPTGANKIVISPMPTSTNSSPPPLEGPFSNLGSPFQIKEEDVSDENNVEESMDFEGSELRPEDLLSVIDDEEQNEIQVKSEPIEVDSAKVSGEKEISDSAVADSSTDPGMKEGIVVPVSLPSCTIINPTMTKNIINYSNDSLSIASVVSGSQQLSHPQPQTQAQPIPISPKNASHASNKISLVPTKLLLKSSTVNNYKATPTIVYSSVQSSTSVAGTITTNAQSSIPMKFVVVNAVNNNANAQQTVVQKSQQITLNKSLSQLQQSQNSAFLANKFIGSTQGQKVQIVQTTNFNSVPKVSTTVTNGDMNSSKGNQKLLGTKLPAIRNLLTNIVEIENQRLEIEKQRFEYEKSVGNELLSMLKSFISSSQSTTCESNLQDAKEKSLVD
ncbi:CLUMA_CG011936, isoform A [Clunio marinus]|uniref:CLUMA_CG011936, isoform A n=1 Tax=Clunio marinus TaxID=568069 RepID=A0A1J1IGW3_9DIPT|nr:CLUMA_CG011936, isoform A [Clunio marinus]